MAPPPRKAVPLLLAAGLTLSACADAATDAEDRAADAAASLDEATDGSGSEAADRSAVDLPPPVILDVPDPNSVYDPVRGGEALPDGFRQVLARDAIPPVYDPSFVTASGVGWPDDSLVIGVDLEGETRAYPVDFLNRREIVNDNHRGIPTLVTW